MEAKRIKFVDADGAEVGAQFPHCDDQVLHAPGECQFCDLYPEAQAARVVNLINFTGHYSAGFAVCPSEHVRSLQSIHSWPGNRPSGPSAADAALKPELRDLRTLLLEEITYQPESEGALPHTTGNMPATMVRTTLATRTDARDELGAAVSAIANNPVDLAAIQIGIAMILEAIGKPPRCSQCSDLDS